jgi:hypothetical protein
MMWLPLKVSISVLIGPLLKDSTSAYRLGTSVYGVHGVVSVLCNCSSDSDEQVAETTAIQTTLARPRTIG